MKKLIYLCNIVCLVILSTLLFACGGNVKDLSISLIQGDLDLYVSQEITLDIKVENYFEIDAKFDFYQTNVLLTIDQNYTYKGDGIFTFNAKVKAIGSSTLTITLLQGGSSTEVNVNVGTPLTDFYITDANSNFVIKGGDGLDLSSDIFTFMPEECRQTNVVFSLAEENDNITLENNTLIVANDFTEDKIDLIATSVFNADLSTSFFVNVLDEISLNNITISNYKDDIIYSAEITSGGDVEDYVIELVTNDSTYFATTLDMTCDDSYEYSFSSKKDTLLVQSNVGYSNDFEITLQKEKLNAITSDIFVITVNYPNYEYYTKTIKFNVNYISKATQVRINGVQDCDDIKLFHDDNAAAARELSFSTYPAASKGYVKIDFCGVGEEGITGDKTKTTITIDTLLSYINLTYKNIKIEKSTVITDENDKNKILLKVEGDSLYIYDLSNPLCIYGKSILAEYKCIQFAVTCLGEHINDDEVVNSLNVYVLESAESIDIDTDIYANRTIYMYAGEEGIFNGFKVKNPSAHIGTMNAQTTTAGNLIASAAQTEYNKAELKIVAKKVGTVVFNISISGGSQAQLVVIVYDKIDINDFYFGVNSNNGDVSEVEYAKIGDVYTLEKVNSKTNGSFVIEPCMKNNKLLSAYLSFTSKLVTTTNTYTFTTYNEAGIVDVSVNIVYYIVSEFQLVCIRDDITAENITNKPDFNQDIENAKNNYNFKINIYKQVENLELLAINNGDSSTEYASSVFAYNKSTVGEVDNAMTEISFKLSLNKELVEDLSAYEFYWSFSIGSYCIGEDYYLDNDGKNVGTFNSSLDNLMFVCDSGNDILNIDFIKINFSINQFGKITTSTVYIELLEYEVVESVWLYNYVETLYIDPTYDNISIYTYVLPTNATNKAYTVSFEPDSQTAINIINIYTNDNQIVISCNNNGGGTGNIVIAPHSRIVNGKASYEKKIPIVVGDGLSKQTAIRISSFEQFMNIDLSKHYVITGVIDAKNYIVEQLGELTGSIGGSIAILGKDGEVEDYSFVGSIVNLNITKQGQVGFGLFSSIASSAEVYDLSVFAKVNLDESLKASSTSGVLACSNYGTITNVCVQADYSGVLADGNSAIGGIVGTNNGEIKTTDKCQNTVMAKISATISENSLGDSICFGAIAGSNSGTITQSHEGSIINDYGISAIVNILLYSNVTNGAIGGIVGANTGIISKLFAKGRIEAETSNYVGGLVGKNSGNPTVNGNTSQVYVYGNDYVAGLIGNNSAVNDDVKDNKVEAVDDGKSFGIKASLVVGFASNTAAIANGNAGTDNIACTYISRAKVDVIKDDISLDEYYGDLIVLKNKAEITSNNKFEGILQFDPIEVDLLKYPNNAVVLMYYKLLEATQDMALEQKIAENNTQFLPDDLFTSVKYSCTIESLTPSIISVKADGSLLLNQIGLAKLKITNNYDVNNTFVVNIIVQNYIGGVQLFTNANLQDGEVFDNSTIIDLKNSKTEALYTKFSNNYETSNYIVELEANKTASVQAICSENVDIQVDGNTILLSVTNPGANITETDVFVYPYINIMDYRVALSDDIRVLDDAKQKFVVGSLSACVDTYKYTLNVSQTKGISNIFISQDNITMMPSQTASISVVYKNLSSDVMKLSIYDIDTGLTYVVQYENNSYICEDELFIITASTAIKNASGNYSQTFNISVNSDKIKSGNFIVTFSGNGDNLARNLKLNIIKQAVESVSVFNYSFTENQDNLYTVDDETGEIVLNTSYSLSQSSTITLKQPNLLKVLVSPDYVDYSYIEIKSNDGMLFWLMKGQEGIDGKHVVSSDGILTANGLKILKHSVDDQEINIMYTIQQNFEIMKNVSFTISIFDENGMLMYDEITKTYVTDSSNRVDIKIAGANETDSNELSKSYYLARGMAYGLDISLDGFTLDQIVIKSSSENSAKITEKSGVYYLEINDDIAYKSDEEGCNVTIKYYAEYEENNKICQSVVKELKLTIVEYVVDSFETDDLFGSSTIDLFVGDTVDIRWEIVNDMEIYYSNSASSSVAVLKQSLVKNAYWFHRVSSNVFVPMDENTEVEAEYIKINKGFNVKTSLLPTTIYSYDFGFYAKLFYKGGYLVIDSSMTGENADIENFNDFSQIMSFDVEILRSVNSENPLPISSYEQLLEMKENTHYILMDDIVLPASFKPIKTKIASFDGNGYDIVFAGNYTNELCEKFGLFETITEEMLIKNVNIRVGDNNVTQSTNFQFNNTLLTSNFVFGLLTAENKGIVYNCSVSMNNIDKAFLVQNIKASSETDYIAAFVGINNGNIINCHTKANISARGIDSLSTSGGNLSGFVGVNNKKISASYIKDLSIDHSNATSENRTAGFVIENNGEINACYVEGTNRVEPIYIYADKTSISSSTVTAGFVYFNTTIGKISDCYSNILINCSATNSSFAYINYGEIKNSFSLCTYEKGGDALDYPFVVQYKSEVEQGKFDNCFYLQDEANKINTGVANNSQDFGVKKLTLKEFADKNNFANYAINEVENKTIGVWFFAEVKHTSAEAHGDIGTESQSVQEVMYSYFTEVEGYSYKGENMSFVANRPHLVAANLLAYSNKEIASEEYDENTGETTFTYTQISASSQEGTILNPITISSAEELENYMISYSKNKNIDKHFRMINNVDYKNTSIVASSVHEYKFLGYFEGNNMAILNYVVNSAKTYVNGGFFAEVGSAYKYATIQNIVFAPALINMPSTQIVGAVAGTLTNGYIYNVNVNGYQDPKNPVLVIGKNLVGGIFGRTLNYYEIFNTSSSVSANATYSTTFPVYEEDEVAPIVLYKEGYGHTFTSYAGGIVGHLGGYGSLKYASVTNNIAAIGMVAGFAFGGIGNNAKASYVQTNATNNKANFIRASVYGGLLVGDIRGTLSNSIVLDEKTETDGKNDIYKVSPKIPFGIGGIAGCASGAIITDCNMYADLDISNKDKALSVGGIVGVANINFTIKNVNVFSGIIQAKQNVGGLVGKAKVKNFDSGCMDIENCNVGTTDIKAILYLQKNDSDYFQTTANFGVGIGALHIVDKATEKDKNLVKLGNYNVEIQSNIILKEGKAFVVSTGIEVGNIYLDNVAKFIDAYEKIKTNAESTLEEGQFKTLKINLSYKNLVAENAYDNFTTYVNLFAKKEVNAVINDIDKSFTFENSVKGQNCITF